MSENKNIYSRLIEFQSKVEPIKKNETNPFFKSRYATLDAIQFAIQKPLAEAGLGYIQEATNDGLKTTLFDIEGKTIESVYPAVFQGKPQDIGSALSYAKRYSLIALLGLIIEGEDDDGNKAQESNKQEYKGKPKIEHWLTDVEYNKAMAEFTPVQIKTVLNMKTTKEGKIFGIKKEFREGLQNKLNSTK